MATHFKQYNFCEICKRNHVDGKKHVYTKFHRETTEKMLKKFRGKFSEMKKAIKTPEIHYDSWEANSKLWCYVCDCDVEKHIVEDDLTIAYFGMMKHASSEAHHKAVKQFWWQNKLQKEHLAKYVLQEEGLKRFTDMLPLAKQKYKLKMCCLHKLNVRNIQSCEEQRQAIVKMAQAESVEPVINNTHLLGSSNYQKSQTGSMEKRQGNIFTGAIPPWMWDDSSTTKHATEHGFGHTSASIVGPTVEEYHSHLKKEKKKRLNPHRVGADFDHSAKTSASWLPSFGRVWNNGRRLQSRYQYRKEVLKQRKTNPPK